MKRFIFIVLSENVAAKYQSVHRLGIKNWDIKSVKFVFFNRDTSFFAAVKVLLLIVYIGYFRIDGNNGIGELEQAGQRIDETVLRMITLRQAPVSYHPLQSPHKRIAVPDV